MRREVICPAVQKNFGALLEEGVVQDSQRAIDFGQPPLFLESFFEVAVAESFVSLHGGAGFALSSSVAEGRAKIVVVIIRADDAREGTVGAFHFVGSESVDGLIVSDFGNAG